MYADRYAGPSRFNPGGLAAAVGINAAVVVALMFAVPNVAPPVPDRPFEGTLIDLAPPPPPDPVPPREPEVRSAPRPAPRPDAPIPEVPTTIDDSGIVTAFDPGPLPTGDAIGTGSGSGVTVEPPAPAPPVIVGPGLDPRYAGDLQPPYPAAERRMGNGGRVTVRVLVGADGRVKQVERVSATSDAFFRATAEQARRRWRFRPGTRDGVAQAAWRVMTVTFVLED